jgi:hypothetical protein
MTELRRGDIIAYPYLWKWQRDRGESEGRKSRPVCTILAVKAADGLTHLALLAISSKPPGPDQVAIEIPEIECRRVGLSEFSRAWVTVSEYNYDIAERSFYFEPEAPPLGRFSRSFMMRIAAEAAPLMRSGQARVDRME